MFCSAPLGLSRARKKLLSVGCSGYCFFDASGQGIHCLAARNAPRPRCGANVCMHLHTQPHVLLHNHMDFEGRVRVSVHVSARMLDKRVSMCVQVSIRVSTYACGNMNVCMHVSKQVGEYVYACLYVRASRTHM